MRQEYCEARRQHAISESSTPYSYDSGYSNPPHVLHPMCNKTPMFVPPPPP